MNMTKYEVAFICNNLLHADDYSVVGDKAYYKGELIFTDIKITWSTKNRYLTRDRSFKCVKPLEYVEVKFTVKLEDGNGEDLSAHKD
jgi:hypothetical protein